MSVEVQVQQSVSNSSSNSFSSASVVTVVATAACVIERDGGFVGTADAAKSYGRKLSTKILVMDVLNNAVPFFPTAVHYQQARAAIEWITNEANVRGNDYLSKLRQYVRDGVVSQTSIGFLVSLLDAHARAEARAARKGKSKPQPQPQQAQVETQQVQVQVETTSNTSWSDFLTDPQTTDQIRRAKAQTLRDARVSTAQGVVSDKVTRIMFVLHATGHSSNYFNEMVDAHGNFYTWSSSTYKLTPNLVYRVTGLVTGHKQINGNIVTELSRCRFDSIDPNYFDQLAASESILAGVSAVVSPGPEPSSNDSYRVSYVRNQLNRLVRESQSVVPYRYGSDEKFVCEARRSISATRLVIEVRPDLAEEFEGLIKIVSERMLTLLLSFDD